MKPRTPPARRHVEAATDAAGVSRIGGRPIHAYWLLLAPHLRDVFLAPERHLGDHTLAWSWNTPETDAGDAVSPALCAEARSRLASVLERLREELAEKSSNTESDERRRLLRELAVSLERWAAGLLSGTDTHVAGFLARTSHGLMFHSWGLAQPAQPVAASSSREAEDALVASPAATPTVLRRLLRSRLLQLAIISALVLGVLVGMRTCRNTTTPASPVTAAVPPERAAREDDATTTTQRIEAATPATSTTGKSPFSAQTGGARPSDLAGRSPAVSSRRNWSATGSRKGSTKPPAGEAFEGRDAAPALPSSGLSGAARVGGAATAAGSGSSASSAATAGAGQVPAGSTAAAGGAPAPTSATVQNTSDSSSPQGASPAALPSGQSSVGDRATASPDDDTPIAKDPTAPATREPQPPSPAPSGASADDPAEPDPKPISSAALDPAVEPPSPNIPREPPSEAPTEAEGPPSISDLPAPDDTREEATESTAPGRTNPSSGAAGKATRPGTNEAERLDDGFLAADAPERAAPFAPNWQVGDQVHHVRFRTHTWRAQLLRDAILPTAPRPTGKMDAVNPMRAELWQHHNAARPAWMDHPRIHVGTTLHWPNTTEAGDLVLDGIDGQEVVARWLSSHELELSWPADAAPAVVTVRGRRDGEDRILAQAKFSTDIVEVRAEQPLTHRTWLSLERDGGVSHAEHAWRLIAGPPLTLPVIAPDTETARIDMPSNAAGDGLIVRTLAIVDPESGWALVGEVETSSGTR